MKKPTSARKRGRPRFAAELRVYFPHCKVRPQTVVAFENAAAKSSTMSIGLILDQLGETLNS